ncbi:hypothetical protein [Curvivirga aplysinae]|uniref:hypothetical protein n=1 Tax=Curvivirga aplysinae TaxID=2529852 RepID=UPI0012BBF1CD|nr:hypothetical protein [Curvivirga aplysinae]MTI08333.1 hypothetical protein [Curvivirga aplysinae]
MLDLQIEKGRAKPSLNHLEKKSVNSQKTISKFSTKILPETLQNEKHQQLQATIKRRDKDYNAKLPALTLCLNLNISLRPTEALALVTLARKIGREIKKDNLGFWKGSYDILALDSATSTSTVKSMLRKAIEYGLINRIAGDKSQDSSGRWRQELTTFTISNKIMRDLVFICTHGLSLSMEHTDDFCVITQSGRFVIFNTVTGGQKRVQTGGYSFNKVKYIKKRQNPTSISRNEKRVGSCQKDSRSEKSKSNDKAVLLEPKGKKADASVTPELKVQDTNSVAQAKKARQKTSVTWVNARTLPSEIPESLDWILRGLNSLRQLDGKELTVNCINTDEKLFSVSSVILRNISQKLKIDFREKWFKDGLEQRGHWFLLCAISSFIKSLTHTQKEIRSAIGLTIHITNKFDDFDRTYTSIKDVIAMHEISRNAGHKTQRKSDLCMALIWWKQLPLTQKNEFRKSISKDTNVTELILTFHQRTELKRS